ncbi:hypothetical protein Rleg4DRAFT_6024 [Rhizobium leguminosarum bv. trifolii WSM2297]|uniref:Uncharacterized protein n=1 Tax=Rhizobium leguminosarum bv. trifolii WSM2297 TaxID=754762 RepID=J0WEH2_RHILT|nr:hypothetical protein Rleg4DRAFT_6024 [Rhizobium leguminosarum bv. trifolii WSM2297]
MAGHAVNQIPVDGSPTVLDDADVALCQRVYNHVISVKQVNTDRDREELASRSSSHSDMG